MTDPPPQLYARDLLPFGYGYPLWTPEPSHELLLCRQDGLRIGDVGVIDLENGSFDVFFNICLPREHPLHRITGVPDNFVPIQLNEWDIATYPHAEYPGRVISTSSVTARSNEPSGQVTSRSPFTYEFSLSSSEGALLILPKGAEAYKLRKKQIFRNIAIQNAANWYNFAEQHLGRIISHDSLYLITGLYKTRSWSAAAFHQTTGSAESSAHFKAQAGDGDNMSYAWETMRALDWRVGPQIDVGIPNQSVFISGFKIAIGEGLLGKKWVEVEVDTALAQSRSVKFSNGGNGPSPSRAGNFWRRFVSRGGSGGRKSSPASRSTKDSRTTLQSGHAGVTGHTTIDHVPQPLQSPHPSDIVNRYLLSKEPSASVAITHDSQWSILFEKGLLKPEDLSHDGRVERIVSENYRLVLQDGAVYLQTPCDSSIRLTNIDDAVREAWQEDKLDDVEEILSGHLIRCTGSDHSVFANRALIRARLHYWGAALRDAETSIDIQPSVVAHVAMGFALFGQDKYESAVEAFNVALRQCDVHDRDIVLLIKSIVLFDVRYHAESMAVITDLIERGPVELKSACSSVRAEMYVRLATLATKKEDYDRALQLLSRALSLGPFRAVPDMNIISLICGWRFDNLQFTIHRQNCEVLHLAGRTNEALESLRAFTHDLGEDIRTRKDNADWITAFTQRCLKSLEGLGDNAMMSQSHTEAIAYYSTTLSTGPATREGILIKRSKAYAAACMWDDALKDANEAINLNPLSPLGHERKYEVLQGMGQRDEAGQTLNHMHSILEHSSDPQSQHLRSRYGNPPQSITVIQTPNPRTSAPLNHLPHHTPENNSVIEPMATTSQPPNQYASNVMDTSWLEREEVVRAQNISTRYLEQERRIQLAELTAQITTLQEQLASDIAIADRNRLLFNQLTDVRNTILRLPHVQGTTVSQESDRSKAKGGTPVPLHAREPVMVVDSIQEPISRRKLSETLMTPPEHARDMDDERYPSVHASQGPVLLPTSVEVPSDEHNGDDDTYEDRSEDTQRDELRRGHHSQQRREAVIVRPHGSPDIATTPPPMPMPIPSITMTSPGIERSMTRPSRSISDTEVHISSRGRGPLTSHPQAHFDPTPMVADNLPRQRKQSSENYSPRQSEGRMVYPIGSNDPPGRHRHAEIDDTLTAAPYGFVQQPGVFGQPLDYTRIPSGTTLSPPEAPLYDTLIEMMREHQRTHGATIDQQQELMRHMWSFSEWFMREMQDRLTELRGMPARAYSHLPRPGELGLPPQYYQGVGSAGPIGYTPWTTSSTPWYPPPPFHTASHTAPLVPSWVTQQTPYVPPDLNAPASGASSIPQQPGGSKGNEEGPWLGQGHPLKTSSPIIALPLDAKAVPASEPVSSQVHVTSNALNSPPPSRRSTRVGITPAKAFLNKHYGPYANPIPHQNPAAG